MQEWLKIKSVPGYVDVSERTVREWLKGGLRHARLPSGTIMIKRVWLDAFLEQYADDSLTKEQKVEKIADSVMRDLGAKVPKTRGSDG